jgi:hypothetical protein
LEKVKALRKAGLRAEHVAFSFMKRRVEPLMARDNLGYEYTRAEDSSRMPGEEIDNEVIIERLERSLRICPRSCLAAWRSTPQHTCRKRLVVVSRAPEY